MIKDRLVNASTYYSLSENIKRGFEWLLSKDLDKAESKKYIIDGESLYANIQEYETKTEADYEAHRKYIDIQYVIRGKESVGITNINNCETCIKYDEEKDIEFFKCKTAEHYEELQEGDFLILYPQDAHKPSMDADKKYFVKKVVVKVAIE